MRARMALTLLRRIALRLPVAVGPLVVGMSSSACTSSHPRSSFAEAYVGPPERFDPTNCNALCRALDALDPVDAPGLDGGTRERPSISPHRSTNG